LPARRRKCPLQPSWRTQALELLKDWDGDVLVPEFEEPTAWDSAKWDEQFYWERDALERATVIAFWIPREMNNMPGLTTNVEFGYWSARRPQKCLLGYPPEAEHIKYLSELALVSRIPTFDTLTGLLRTAKYRAGH